MKSQLTGTSPAGAEAAPGSLQEELVAAIHGAFEVAVEIAVREVKKLLGQASGDGYEEMRRENESLKQRLHRAEAMLDRARTEGAGAPVSKQRGATAGPAELKLRLHLNPGSPEPTGLLPHRGDAPSAGHSRAQRRPDPQDKRTCGPEEQRSGHEATPRYGRDAAAAEPEKEAERGCSRDVQDISGVAVKVENTSQPYQDLAAQDHHSPPRLNSDSKPASEHVTVKQEKSEEEICLDSIKEEDFNLECLSAVQSKMLAQWEATVPDIQRQDPNATLSCTRLEHAHSSDVTLGLPDATDLPSLSSDLAVLQLEEPASMSKAPPQVYGVHVRIRHTNGHNMNSYYSCKSCSQSFPLPSLLRRHYGQCQQKHSQQPVVGSKRHKVQIYPPGCSPFRCTVCNREFNRMENLKTHLRIHTGERPYTCSVCSKCFRHSGALTRHFRIHTGEKPYVCGQCGKSFRNCGGLKFHERVHSRQLQ